MPTPFNPESSKDLSKIKEKLRARENKRILNKYNMQNNNNSDSKTFEWIFVLIVLIVLGIAFIFGFEDFVIDWILR